MVDHHWTAQPVTFLQSRQSRDQLFGSRHIRISLSTTYRHNIPRSTLDLNSSPCPSQPWNALGRYHNRYCTIKTFLCSAMAPLDQYPPFILSSWSLGVFIVNEGLYFTWRQPSLSVSTGISEMSQLKGSSISKTFVPSKLRYCCTNLAEYFLLNLPRFFSLFLPQLWKSIPILTRDQSLHDTGAHLPMLAPQI